MYAGRCRYLKQFCILCHVDARRLNNIKRKQPFPHDVAEFCTSMWRHIVHIEFLGAVVGTDKIFLSFAIARENEAEFCSIWNEIFSKYILYAVKLNSSSVSVEKKKIYRVVLSAQTQSSKKKKILQTYVNNFTSRASGIWTTTMIICFSLTHSSTHRSIFSLLLGRL